MKTFGEFHDGFLDGFLVQNTTVLIYLSTYDRREFVLTARGVFALKVDGFREGNIIFDVLVKDGDEMILDDIVTAYEFRDVPKAEVKFAEVMEKGLLFLEINPSYGAICTVLAASIELSPRHS